MYIHPQSSPRPTHLPGIAHATWAGAEEGLRQLSVWRQTMAAGGCTPPHQHDCDEIVLCQAGWGELHIAGAVHRFGVGTVLVLPRGVPHQIFSVGPMPLETIAAFGATPVGTCLPDGTALELPWRS